MLAVTLVPLALLPFAQPTAALGAAGWAVALSACVGVVGVACTEHARQLRTPPQAMMITSFCGIALLSLLQWLAGGQNAPYDELYPLIAVCVAVVQPARRVLVMLVAIAVALLLPWAYEGWDGAAATAALSRLLVCCAVAGVVHSIMRSVRDQRLDVREEHVHAREEARRLAALDGRRTRFVFSAVHDLRTPLTSIKGYLEAFLEGDAGELRSEQRDYVKVVYRNARRLQVIVEDLMVVSGQASPVQLDRRVVDLRAALADVRSEFVAVGRAAGVGLVADAPETLLVCADPIRLDQLLTNLVSNAIKYSRRGEHVILRCCAHGDDVAVEIVDRGVGIPADELARVTEYFFRASTAGEVEGTGVGLAIVRELAELHGGSLEIESVPGVGSTFRVVLPRLRGRPRGSTGMIGLERDRIGDACA